MEATMCELTATNGNTIQFPETINETGKVHAKLWESGVKKRVYFKVYWAKSSPTDCGYVDMVDGSVRLQSSPRGVAQRLESMINFIGK